MPLLPLTLPNAECWSKAFSGTLFLHGVDNIQEFNSRNVNSGEETFAVVVVLLYTVLFLTCDSIFTVT